MEEFVYVWDDGSYCWRDELEETIKLNGDKYKAVHVDEFFKEIPCG